MSTFYGNKIVGSVYNQILLAENQVITAQMNQIVKQIQNVKI